MSTNSIASRSTAALAWSVIGAIAKIGGQLVVQITLARILDPVVFGQYAAMLAVFGLGYILSDGGFGSALIQKKQIDDNDIGLALGWSLMFACVTAAIIYFSSPALANLFGDGGLIPMFRACALLIPFQIVLNLSSSLLRRELRMKGMQVISIIAYIVFFGGVAIALALKGFGVWALVAGFAAQTLFALFATYLLMRHTLRPKLRGDRALIQFGIKALCIELGSWSMDNLDRFLIGKWWGLYSLGLYSVSYNLSKAPTALLVSAAQSIAFASSARLQSDISATRRGFLIVLPAIALLTLPVFTVVAIEAPAVLHIVYGSKWIAAAPYMTALACAIPFIAIGAITAAFLRGTGTVGIELHIQLIAGMALFASFFILRNASLNLAVWAVPGAYLLRLLLLLNAVRNRLQFRVLELTQALSGCALVTITTGLTTIIANMLTANQFPDKNYIPLIVGILTPIIFSLIFSQRVFGPTLLSYVKINFLSCLNIFKI